MPFEPTLSVEPTERLVFEVSTDAAERARERSTQTLRLTSTSNRPVAFRLKTTVPQAIQVQPGAGLLKPGAWLTVKVVLKPGQGSRVANQRLMIQTVAVDSEESFGSGGWDSVRKVDVKEFRLQLMTTDKALVEAPGPSLEDELRAQLREKERRNFELRTQLDSQARMTREDAEAAERRAEEAEARARHQEELARRRAAVAAAAASAEERARELEATSSGLERLLDRRTPKETREMQTSTGGLPDPELEAARAKLQAAESALERERLALEVRRALDAEALAEAEARRGLAEAQVRQRASELAGLEQDLAAAHEVPALEELRGHLAESRAAAGLLRADLEARRPATKDGGTSTADLEDEEAMRHARRAAELEEALRAPDPSRLQELQAELAQLQEDLEARSRQCEELERWRQEELERRASIRNPVVKPEDGAPSPTTGSPRSSSDGLSAGSSLGDPAAQPLREAASASTSPGAARKAIAWPKPSTLSDLALRIGMKVQVRDHHEQVWKIGTVMSARPLQVLVDGYKHKLTWDLILVVDEACNRRLRDEARAPTARDEAELRAAIDACRAARDLALGEAEREEETAAGLRRQLAQARATVKGNVSWCSCMAFGCFKP